MAIACACSCYATNAGSCPTYLALQMSTEHTRTAVVWACAKPGCQRQPAGNPKQLRGWPLSHRANTQAPMIHVTRVGHTYNSTTIEQPQLISKIILQLLQYGIHWAHQACHTGIGGCQLGHCNTDTLNHHCEALCEGAHSPAGQVY